ncbi:MAG: SurA N-terminal domain-containing protein [Myxococcales bacterium]|nr:MAG: SurA N-terminal domain-containing protein [Myxococcales bacterium]
MATKMLLPRPLKQVFIAILLCLYFSQSAFAGIVERVAAVVNDQPIFLSEVRQKATPFLMRAFQAPSETQRQTMVEQIYKEITNQLINEILIEELASTMQVSISEQDVARAIENIQRQNGMDDAGFWEAVQTQGLSRVQYRRDVKKQLLRYRVINQRLRGRVSITEDDVKRRFREVTTENNAKWRYRISHVFIEVPAEATEEQIMALYEKAQGIYAQYPGEFQ